MSPTIRHKCKYFHSAAQRAKDRRQKFHFCRLQFDVRPRNGKLNREIKFAVTWSYVKPQTAKMKLLPSVFSSLKSRVKIFAFVANSRRHFFIFK